MDVEKNKSKIVSNIQDALLKEKVVEFWFIVMNQYMNRKYLTCFQGLKMVFTTIQGYDFIGKDSIEECLNTIDTYVENLEGKPINQKELIQFNKFKMDFQDLVYLLSTMLAKAFIELDLWFKSVNVVNDIDMKLSMDNYKDELTLVEKKRREILGLKKDKIVELLSYNAIHDVYSRGVRENVL